MSGNLQFKRGLKANLPTSAPSGMPLWCEDTKELYIGTDDGISKIASNTGGQNSSDTDFEALLAPYEKIVKPILVPVPETKNELDDMPVPTPSVARVPEIGGGIDLEYLEYQLTDNAIHRITVSEDCTFALPTITDNTTFHQILVQLKLENEVSINLGTYKYFDLQEPNMSVIGNYNLIYEHDGTNWVVGCMRKS